MQLFYASINYEKCGHFILLSSHIEPNYLNQSTTELADDL